MNKTQQDAIFATARKRLSKCSILIHQVTTEPAAAANPEKHLIELKNTIDTIIELLEEEPAGE